MSTQKNIFIGYVEISGFYTTLSEGLSELGYNVTLFTLSKHPFIYKGFKQSKFNVFFIKLVELQGKEERVYLKFLYRLLFNIIRIWLLFWMVIRYEVFIFGFASRLMPNYWEYNVLKFFNKKIISLVMHGSDARPLYIDGFHLIQKDFENVSSLQDIVAETRYKKQTLLKIEKYSDYLISYSLLGHFFTKPFLDYGLCLGMPLKHKVKHLEGKVQGKTFKILHAPSSPKAKGTEVIRTAINNLKKKGYSIEYEEIIGKPNHVVLDKLQKVDLVVDQIYSDVPLSGFGTEAAAFGVPCVIAGYGWGIVDKSYPNIFPPSYKCIPDDIEVSIEYLINNPEEIKELGLKAFEFVTNNWNYLNISKKIDRIINDNIENHWYYDPNETEYIYGAGINISSLRYILTKIISNYGIGALQLSDKPKLEKKFLDFIKEVNNK